MSDNPPKTPLPSVPKTLFATPHSRTSTATAPGADSAKVDALRPLIGQDMQLFKLGSLERYLFCMLRAVGAITGDFAIRPSDEEIREKLQECLNKIDAVVKQKKSKASMDVIYQAFRDYAGTTTEAKRYAHFVRGSNEILSLLERVTVGKCKFDKRTAAADKLQFMVHDPKTIPIEHNGYKGCRKPDVVLSYKKYVDPLYPDSEGKWGTQHLEKGPKDKCLDWEKGLMFLEFKKTKKVLDPPTPWNNPKIGSETSHKYETREDLESQMNPEAPAETATTSVTTAATQPSRHSRASKTVSQSTNGKKGTLKRTATDAVEGGSASKKARTSEARDFAPTAQLGEYCAEALHATFGRNHVLGFMIDDSNINPWHVGHDMPLQLTGFDFLKNPHYLFLFLFCLQRFKDEHWGFLPGFAELVGKGDKTLDLKDAWIDNPNNEQVTFTGKEADMIKHRFGLGGRATGVLYGSVDVAGTPTDVAIKLSWPEKSRPREKVFIDKAKEEFSGPEFATDNPCDYLPTILAAKEYPEFESGPFLQAILQNEEDYEPIKLASRIPYLIAMPKYDPIASLTKDLTTFLTAFFALFYCHAMLWSVGIRHGDISDNNLMWDPKTQKPKLCDFDLSHLCEKPERGVEEVGPDGPTGFSNTGTWIFMAAELLSLDAMDGLVKRVYRHEVEAFIAVLVWIICRYQDGKVRAGPPLREWIQTDYLQCKERRDRTFNHIAMGTFPRPSGVPEDIWELVTDTVTALQNHLATFQAAARPYTRVVRPLRNPGPSPAQPQRRLAEFNDLCALQDILAWPIFGHSSCDLFYYLLEARILKPTAAGDGAPA